MTVKYINREACLALAIPAAAAEAGGKAALARLLQIDRKTLYNWSRSGKVPIEPFNYVWEIERFTKLPRWFLRPDVYEWPAGAAVVTPLGTFSLEVKQ